jgi:RNA polymerase sigma factor (sigma-70 family)
VDTTSESTIKNDQPTSDPAEVVFRRYLAARRARDERVCAETWFQLIELHMDRVRSWIAAVHFAGQRVPVPDRDDVVQDAVLRASDMLASWQGNHHGQWRKALKTTTWNTCADHMRKVITRDRRRAGSFDESAHGDAGSDLGRFDHVVADERLWDDFDHELTVRDVFERLLDRIAGLPNPNHREVLIMTMDGHHSKTIAGRLGTTPNNVDQMRRRALKALEDRDDPNA